jgi:hypothetical protein
LTLAYISLVKTYTSSATLSLINFPPDNVAGR